MSWEEFIQQSVRELTKTRDGCMWLVLMIMFCMVMQSARKLVIFITSLALKQFSVIFFFPSSKLSRRKVEIIFSLSDVFF